MIRIITDPILRIQIYRKTLVAWSDYKTVSLCHRRSPCPAHTRAYISISNSRNVPGMNVSIESNDESKESIRAAIAAEKMIHPNSEKVAFYMKQFKGELAPQDTYPRLKTLIFSVLHHLVQSVVTRSAFITVFEIFYHELTPEIQQQKSVPTDAELLQALARHWPSFDIIRMTERELKANKNGVAWASVRSGSEVPDTIYILGDIVDLAESTENTHMSLSVHKLQLIIVTSILHELTRILTRVFFGTSIRAPDFVAREERKSCLEWVLMVGVVAIQWDNKDDYPVLARANRLVMEPKAFEFNQLYEINDEIASRFIESLTTGRLRTPANSLSYRSEGYIPSSESIRCRVNGKPRLFGGNDMRA